MRGSEPSFTDTVPQLGSLNSTLSTYHPSNSRSWSLCKRKRMTASATRLGSSVRKFELCSVFSIISGSLSVVEECASMNDQPSCMTRIVWQIHSF